MVGSRVDDGDASEGMEGASSGSSGSVGGCLRFKDLSFARRALRSVAAASRDAWEAMIMHSERIGRLRLQLLEQELGLREMMLEVLLPDTFLIFRL